MESTEFTQFTQVDEADVVVDGEQIGRLLRLRDRVRFEYLPSATRAVATSLPLSISPLETHAAGALPPFFAGLLPEGRRLSSLRQAIKTSADDEFSLLLAVGTDTVGDVSVIPTGTSASERNLTPTVTTERWDLVDFGRLYSDSVGMPDRIGMPGVQDKVSARMITLPVRSGDAPLATHILKLNPPEFPHLVENEDFFLHAARRSGLATATASLVRDAHGTPGLLVVRFDRITHRRRTRRIAQEDACQVLRRYPADKYLMSMEDIAIGLIGQCQSRLVAALALVRQIAFAYISGNGDAHAKNFSIVRSDDEWKISPAYDVPSSQPYGDTTMAVALNGKRDQRIGRNDFVDFGRRLGLRDQPVLQALATIADAADVWIPELDNIPFDDRRIHDLTKTIRYRQRRLRGL